MSATWIPLSLREGLATTSLCQCTPIESLWQLAPHASAVLVCAVGTSVPTEIVIVSGGNSRHRNASSEIRTLPTRQPAIMRRLRATEPHREKRTHCAGGQIGRCSRDGRDRGSCCLCGQDLRPDRTSVCVRRKLLTPHELPRATEPRRVI